MAPTSHNINNYHNNNLYYLVTELQMRIWSLQNVTQALAQFCSYIFSTQYNSVMQTQVQLDSV